MKEFSEDQILKEHMSYNVQEKMMWRDFLKNEKKNQSLRINDDIEYNSEIANNSNENPKNCYSNDMPWCNKNI